MEAHPHQVVGVEVMVDVVAIGLVAHALACAAQMFAEVMEDDGVLRQCLLKGGPCIWDVNDVGDSGWLPDI